MGIRQRELPSRTQRILDGNPSPQDSNRAIGSDGGENESDIAIEFRGGHGVHVHVISGIEEPGIG